MKLNQDSINPEDKNLAINIRNYLICAICNKKCNKLSNHIPIHNITSKEYYDIYLKQPEEGYCKTCKNPTKYKSFMKGYRPFCSHKCAVNHPNTIDKFKNTCKERYGGIGYASDELKRKSENTTLKLYGATNIFASEYGKNKIKSTMITRYGKPYTAQVKSLQEKYKQTCLDRYGVDHNWKVPEIRQKCINTSIKRYGDIANIINRSKITQKENLDKLAESLDALTLRDAFDTYSDNWYTQMYKENKLIKCGMYTLVPKSLIPELENYNKLHASCSSYPEQYIANELDKLRINYIMHDRKQIYPLELDFYIPDLSLSIEYNSILYHSNESGTSINYHRNKSILCKNKKIRLIHIYGFEDLSYQVKLIISLINGKDLYNPKDFNKNNLQPVPKGPIPKIYSNKGLTIYGAGKLYKE